MVEMGLTNHDLFQEMVNEVWPCCNQSCLDPKIDKTMQHQSCYALELSSEENFLVFPKTGVAKASHFLCSRFGTSIRMQSMTV